MWKHLMGRVGAFFVDSSEGAPSITPEPVVVQYTPDSVLSKSNRCTHLSVRKRRRFATCSGVAWFHSSFIATANLLGNVVHTYRFAASDKTLTHVQSLNETSGLCGPDNLAFSPDGLVLAVANCRGRSINLYSVNRHTHLIDPTPVARLKCDIPHGLSFSPCSRVLAFTTIEDPGYVHFVTSQ